MPDPTYEAQQAAMPVVTRARLYPGDRPVLERYRQTPDGYAVGERIGLFDGAIADGLVGTVAALGSLETAIEALDQTETTGNAILGDLLSAIGTLNGNVGALGPKVDEQTAAVKANTAQGVELGKKLDILAAKEQATVDALAILNGYNQTIASGAASGTNWSTDFAAAGGFSVLTLGSAPAPVSADAGMKVLRVVLSAATLLGTILGGGAKVYVYHCAGPTDAWNASGAVLLGTYPVASNSSYAVLNGRLVPKGRYLRVQASNGGCSISLDFA